MMRNHLNHSIKNHQHNIKRTVKIVSMNIVSKDGFRKKSMQYYISDQNVNIVIIHILKNHMLFLIFIILIQIKKILIGIN